MRLACRVLLFGLHRLEVSFSRTSLPGITGADFSMIQLVLKMASGEASANLFHAALVAAQVCFLYLGTSHQLLSWAAHGQMAGLKNITSMGNLQGQAGILFNQQNGFALLI